MKVHSVNGRGMNLIPLVNGPLSTSPELDGYVILHTTLFQPWDGKEKTQCEYAKSKIHAIREQLKWSPRSKSLYHFSS